MARKIQRLVKGEVPSLLETSKANELIDAINGLRAIRVSPMGVAKVIVTETDVVIDLSPILDRIEAIERRLKLAKVACADDGRIVLTL